MYCHAYLSHLLTPVSEQVQTWRDDRALQKHIGVILKGGKPKQGGTQCGRYICRKNFIILRRSQSSVHGKQNSGSGYLSIWKRLCEQGLSWLRKQSIRSVASQPVPLKQRLSEAPERLECRSRRPKHSRQHSWSEELIGKEHDL